MTNKRNLSINADCTNANSKRIHHLKILNKNEREENSGNETKEEWKRQSVHKQYLKYCIPLKCRGTELGPLLSCFRVQKSAKREAAGVLKCTEDTQIKRTDRQNVSHCTLYGLINTKEFAKNMMFTTAISYRWLLCKEPHNTAHTPISGCYMHHASKHL